MKKPLHEFGGWLSFFYWMNWLNLMGVSFSGIVALISLFRLPKDIVYFLEPGSVILRSAAVCFLFIRMILDVKDNSMQTPVRLCRLINWYLGVSLSAALFVGVVQYFLIGMHWIDVLLKLVGTAVGVYIWWCIWTSYFKVSKRVLAYYGDHA